MADRNGTAWQRLAGELAPVLAGTWALRGGRGAKAVLIREPYEWAFAWIGLARARVDDDPYLMAGVVPLVMPGVGFNAGYGLRSDRTRGPGRFNLLAEDAATDVQQFVVDHALPRLDPWTEPALAAAAEESFRSAKSGFELDMVQAAGWRVINDTGSPVEPAQAAIKVLENRYAPDDALWYQELITAWGQGGRADALRYLEDHRHAALTRLKLI